MSWVEGSKSRVEITSDQRKSCYGLENHGFTNLGAVYWNLPAETLYEEAILRSEGSLTRGGSLVVSTGKHTARAANDKFIVREPTTDDSIWWGQYNRPYSSEKFDELYGRALSYLQGRDVFVQDGFVGSDPNHQMPIRIITELAWHSIFARNMFISCTDENFGQHIPNFTVIALPSFKVSPTIDGTPSDTVIVLNFDKKLCIIANSGYAGEIKKSIFTVMNYLLPLDGVLTMHCSANVGAKGDVALFFGLSGTGKTTLSADPGRGLIGDDEHGWSEHGIFNFEAGCYAKVINLSPTAEPQIFACTHRFGTILENVIYDPITREIDLNDSKLT